MHQTNPIGRTMFEFKGATVARGESSIANLDWTVRAGESWALTGPTASGKSTLLECIAGKHRLAGGTFERHVPADAIQLVAFKEDSRAFSYAGSYYQQRFEFADEENPLTLRTFLRTGTKADDSTIESTAHQFGLGDRLDLSLMKLSNGQTRRARIARALLAKPELLILDDPFVGIDAGGRVELSELLRKLVECGLTLIFTLSPDDVPNWVGNHLRLPKSGFDFGSRDAQITLAIPANLTPPSPTEPILELADVTVRHGGRDILQNISWTVRAGERWAILGPNGAGKTTLLALACGDHPQAFSNDVRLFGSRRGTGETIWDVKRRVGFVSPEFHLYFAEPLTAFEAATTGFHDTLLYRQPSSQEVDRVEELFRAFGGMDWKDRPFRQLSTGRQRLALLIRALVKRPRLLILDEPFQGMDTSTAVAIRDWLDANVTAEQTLIFVTHRAAEIPRTVTQTLRLESGKRVQKY